MEFISPEVKVSGDGSPMLVCPFTGDAYRSVYGALGESMHVFIRNGFHACLQADVSVLEAGLGSGLNAWLTAREAAATGRTVRYTAVELNPVDPELLTGHPFPDDPLFEAVHRAEWGREVPLTERFTLHKICADLAGTVFDTKFDIVYYDMFAPDTHPRLWTEDIFTAIARAMAPGGILVTYCAKGDVKRALRAAGLQVSRPPGAPGKRHMVRAVKP